MSEKKNKFKKLKKRGQESSSSASSSSESTSSLSSEDESNAGDLKPIKEYLGIRRELARQLFISVKADKLRMMLPQVLKKMELKELEEWCANELSGMSKPRILSILNGQPMVQSSDSNDSDDSGPSLEIISDTEEWGDISDVEMTAREEESASKKLSGSKKDKGRSKIRGTEKGGKESEKTRGKSLKAKIKSEPEQKPSKSGDLLRVKKEGEGTEQGKEKDGESLLDLLELEMRARAIRALIRKEEDIIPTNPTSSATPQNQTTNMNSSSSMSANTRAKDRQISLKVVQDKLEELDSTLRKSVSENAREISEEEDVVLVLQPTMTIELLSSESDDEGGQGKRRNQKLENERILENSSAAIVQEQHKIDGQKEKKKSIETEDKGGEDQANTNTQIKISSGELTPGDNLTSGGEKGAEKSPKRAATDLEMFRMLKKKSQLKDIEDVNKIGEKSSSDCVENETEEAVAESEKKSTAAVSEEEKKEDSSNPKNIDLHEEKKKPEDMVEGVKSLQREIKETKEPENKPELEQGEIDEDKSTDLEIIIDLDDYPDDMEDLETGNKEKSKSNVSQNSQKKRVEIEKENASKSTKESNDRTAETWATRYYQTEDVQSVIKESKIQSEIRKRLRERQRLARLNNSPSLNPAAQANVASQNSIGEKNGGDKAVGSTTGSVNEYLALKNIVADNSSADQMTGNKKIGEIETSNVIIDKINSGAETCGSESKTETDCTKDRQLISENIKADDKT